MLNTILGALLPLVVTFLLGFVAAWRRDFGSKDASTLNRMVLLYAVPMALFAGTVTTSRAALSQNISSRKACRPSQLVSSGEPNDRSATAAFEKPRWRLSVSGRAVALRTLDSQLREMTAVRKNRGD
jgi:hypothetical protein